MTTDTTQSRSFADLGLNEPLLRAVSENGYTTPTPIQEQAIPVVLRGGDVMGGAQTGTGKTASFTLPLLQQLSEHANTSASPARHPTRALILAPTRELAMQVLESVQTYSRYLPLRSCCVYGGVDIKKQIEDIRRGVEIVVATPGRLLDLVGQKAIQLNQVQILVLDEADRMLDMGFIPDIRLILEQLPKKRQSLLFSATFSGEIKKLADQMLKAPQLIEVARRNAVSDTITHRVIATGSRQKRETLENLLRNEADGQSLVFVDTKLNCARLASYLSRNKLQADAIHGDKSQQQRSETLAQFRAGELRILIATDVAARGLDIDDLPYVINYDLPGNPEDYVHRIGRTGRAGRPGNAISLVCEDDTQKLQAIEKLIKFNIPVEKAPELTTNISERNTADATESRRREPPANPRSTPNNAPRSSGNRQRKMIAEDGFDFSRPYESKVSQQPADASSALTTNRNSNKKKLPVAFLLGGQRKVES